MTDTARELFPLTMSGPKTVVQSIGGTRNPDGTRAGATNLDEVPEPTAEELALIEAANAGADTPTEEELEQIATALDPIPDPQPDMADAVGKGKGAAAKA